MKEIKHPTICSAKGCGKPAKFYPTIKMWAKGYPKTSTPMTIDVGMAFCFDHRDYFKIDDIPNLGELALDATKQMHAAPPDPSSAEIQMMPLL
jgi:hypothetical protein